MELSDEHVASTAETSNSVVLGNAMKQLREKAKGYVLDIDLDYFSTWNPFRKGAFSRFPIVVDGRILQDLLEH